MDTPPLGYTVHMDIHDGQVEAFKETASAIIEEVEENEPGTVMYQWFISKDQRTGKLCEWFTDQDAAIAHLTGQALNKHIDDLLETADLQIEVYGTPNEKLAQTLTEFPVSGTHSHVDGFTR